jgi:hypothetical protein
VEEDFPSLDEVQQALVREELEWQKMGISLGNVNFGELGPLLFDLSTRVQALTNCVILNGTISDEEVNYQYKFILLNNLRALRESAPKQKSEALRRQILQGIQMPNGKPPWER